MEQSPMPDVRKQLSYLIQALRMACFPRTLYQCADQLAPLVVQIRNDAAFRHWISENAEPTDVVYCRMALFQIGNEIEAADASRLADLGARILRDPRCTPIVAYGLERLVLILKT